MTQEAKAHCSTLLDSVVERKKEIKNKMSLKVYSIGLSCGAIYLLNKYNVPLYPACLIIICLGTSAFLWEWSKADRADELKREED